MFITKRTPPLTVATELAAAGFVQSLSEALRQDVENHLNEGQVIYSTIENGNFVGMSIFRTMGANDDILYLCGTIFMPEAQQRGFASQVIRLAQSELGSQYLALRTQSPRMWRVGQRLCREWYPDPHREIPPLIRGIGKLVGAEIGSEFPVTAGYYGGPLYGAKPLHQDPKLQAWWDRVCSFERGDAVLCVGSF
ncbi:MAG: hypothetical protein AAB490_03970 [Patescibacteria group bacterium]